MAEKWACQKDIFLGGQGEINSLQKTGGWGGGGKGLPG